MLSNNSHSAYHRDVWYPNNKQRRIELNKAAKRRIKEHLDALKIEKGCVDCGYNKEAVALDFDHVSGDKSFSIAFGLSYGYGLPKLLAEVEKCEVRCANCHRIKTHSRQ